MIHRHNDHCETGDPEYKELPNGRLEAYDDGKVVFRMLLDESEGGQRYAYRPGQLVLDPQWAKANDGLLRDLIDVDGPKQQALGGTVFNIRPELNEQQEKDVPEVFEEILTKANLRPKAPEHPGEVVEALPVTPRLVFVPDDHGPPFGGHGAPRKRQRAFQPLPDPGTDAPGYGVRVGLIDTGAYSKHTWWGGHMDARQDDEEPNPDYNPRTGKRRRLSGHGTFIAGVILRSAPGATIVSRRVVGAKHGEFDELTLVSILDEMANMDPPVDIINVSFGVYSPYHTIPRLLNEFLERRQGGAPVIVASAGNDGLPDPQFPAADPRVIGVGATDNRGRLARFSNYGKWVDAYAPGVRVKSTFIEWLKDNGEFEDRAQGPWASWSGTSFAAPVVCGRIAAAMRPNGAAAASLDAETAAKQVLQGGWPLAPGVFVNPRYAVS